MAFGLHQITKCLPKIGRSHEKVGDITSKGLGAAAIGAAVVPGLQPLAVPLGTAAAGSLVLKEMGNELEK
jgi:hypothetical protein